MRHFKDHIIRKEVLQSKADLTDDDMKAYQVFWNIPDDKIEAAWLAKLEMHVFPVKTASLILDIAPWDAYVSPATNKLITSKSERREDMKSSGCRDWEGIESEKKVSARAKAYEEEKQDKAIEDAAIDVLKNLPGDKKDILLNG